MRDYFPQATLVTIDAIGTQTDIGQLLHSKSADHCLALKGNQRGGLIF